MRANISIASSRTFCPRDIRGCSIWLRGDIGVTMDGSNRVTSWADQSGNARNFLQNGANNLKPLYTASGVGGRPSLDFDGAAQYLALASNYTVTSAMSFFCVYVTDAPATSQAFITGLASSDASLIWEVGGSIQFRSAVSDLGSVAVTTNTSNRVMLFTSTFASPGVQNVYMEGVAGTPTAKNWDNFRINELGRRTAANWFDGRIAEIALYTSVLSSYDRNRLTRYAGQRYGITVS